jgi:hypothetical protein
VLILPENSEAAKNADTVTTKTIILDAPLSNFSQWMNFLFGSNSKNISK